MIWGLQRLFIRYSEISRIPNGESTEQALTITLKPKGDPHEDCGCWRIG